MNLFPVASLFLFSFFLVQTSPAAILTWRGSTGGDFNSPGNWSPARVPGPADTAVINSGSVSFASPSAITAGIVTVNVPYSAPTADVELAVTGQWNFTKAFNLTPGKTFSVSGGGSVSVGGPASLVGANLTVSEASTLSFPGLTTLSYSYNGQVGIANQWKVEDAGSKLSFPALKTLVGSAQYRLFGLSVQAEGGLIDFPALVSIIKPKDPTGEPNGGVSIFAREGGTISAPLLALFEDDDTPSASSLYADTDSFLKMPKLAKLIGVRLSVGEGAPLPALASISGNVDLQFNDATASFDKLTTLDGVRTVTASQAQLSFPSLKTLTGSTRFAVGADSQLSLPALTTVAGSIDLDLRESTFSAPLLTTVTHGSFYVDLATLKLPLLRSIGDFSLTLLRGSVDLPVLTSIQGGGWNLNGGTLSIPTLTSLGGLGSILVYSGTYEFPAIASLGNTGLDVMTGSLSFPGVVQYTSTSGTSWQVQSTTGRLTFTSLRTITGSGDSATQLRIGASSGSLEMPVLTSIKTPARVSATFSGGVQLSSTSGGSLSAPQLVTFEDVNANSGSLLTMDSTSPNPTPKLTSAPGVNLDLGQVDLLRQLKTFSGGISFTIRTSVELTQVTSLKGISYLINGGGVAVNFPNATLAPDPVHFSVSGSGNRLSFPALKSVPGPSTFSATDGTLDFPVLNTASGDFVSSHGTLNFPKLNSIGAGTFNFMNQGTMSVPALKSTGGLTQISVSYGTKVTFPALATVPGTLTMSVQQGELDLPALTKVSGSLDLEDNVGTVTLPVLATIAHGLVNVTSASLDFPDLTSVDGLSSITLSQGGQITFPKVYRAAGRADWSVSSSFLNGGLISFPTLRTITGPTVDGDDFLISAAGYGGPAILDLPLLTSIEVFRAGTKADGGVALSAVQGGKVSAPRLTRFEDISANPDSSLAIETGGVLVLPLLEPSAIVGVYFHGISPVAQTLGSIRAIPTQTLGNAPFLIPFPVATSGLTPKYSILSGPATVVGRRITLTGVGTVIVAADQPGNPFYRPAPQVRTSFTVMP